MPRLRLRQSFRARSCSISYRESTRWRSLIFQVFHFGCMSDHAHACVLQIFSLRDWRRRALVMRSKGIPVVAPALDPTNPYASILKVGFRYTCICAVFSGMLFSIRCYGIEQKRARKGLTLPQAWHAGDVIASSEQGEARELAGVTRACQARPLQSTT